MALLMVGTVFDVCSSFCYVEKMIRSKCLDPVKHINLTKAIILIRLLWLPGILKICVSFADNYITFISLGN